MWNIEGNRRVIVWISVVTGCLLLYNAWGPILLVTVSLLVVVYACYSLIVNDSLVSPEAYLLLDYSREAGLEARTNLLAILRLLSGALRSLWLPVSRTYRTGLEIAMDRPNPRRSNYQLSTDNSYSSARNTPRGHALIDKLSPIPRLRETAYNDDALSENSFYRSNSPTYHRNNFAKHCSTPLFPQEGSVSRNGLIEAPKNSPKNSSKKLSPLHSQQEMLTRGENVTHFGPEGSPWGTSVSPKIRDKASGVKTVQTVAGPLLASTRYNIDPKLYSDVTSPGLTTRLTKYATEANTKLTHQSQYCTGQFPKVNLHASPVPLINAKSVKMRTPVTVRVAPPEATRYSPPGRQQILSNACHAENKSPPSVVQVLREISLKRHASREDVASDLAKKQRTDGVIPDEFETQDETKQKRSRDESSKSEEDASPQNKTVRPTKRTKTPSCYDILNSLSSSIHIVSGVKRKANFSRSGTPDFEKHFKSTESAPVINAHTVPQPQQQLQPQPQPQNAKQVREESKEKSPKQLDLACSPEKRAERTAQVVKGILKSPNRSWIGNNDSKDTRSFSETNVKQPNVQQPRTVASSESVNLTTKLFMRAEPHRNERLKLLIEEQGSIKPKFTTDDVEEIKKEDIVNMRQVSMKARLQNMFDAISGKISSKINPDIVIQAEEITTSKPANCPVSCATLNSATTTTNVNTTPISTSAVAPALTPTTDNAKPTKHVAFNIPTTTEPSQPATVSTPLVSAVSSSQTSIASPVASLPQSTIVASSSGLTTTLATAVTTSNSTSVAGGFTFGKPVTSTPATSAVPALSTPASFFKTPTAVSSVSLPTSSTATNSQPSQLGTNASQPASSSTGAPFIFGGKPVSSPASIPMPSVPAQNPTTAASLTTQSTTSVFSAPMNVANSSSTPNPGLLFKSPASTASPILPAATSAGTAASPFSFGTKTAQPVKTEGIFAFGLSGPAAKTSNAFGGTATTAQQSASLGNPTTNISFPAASQTVPKPLTVPSTGSTATSGGGFGVPATSSIFTFGASAAPTSKPDFSFGPSATNTTSSLTGTTTSSVTFPAISTSSSSFGTSTGFPTVQFGTAASTTTASTPVASTSASIFGTGTSAPLFGTATSQPLFGSSLTTGTSSAFGAPRTTAAPLFGSNHGSTAVSATTSPTTAPIFGAATTSSSSGTTSTPIFGQSGTVSTAGTASTTSSNLFSNANANANTNASTVPTSSTAVFGTSSNIFGQSMLPTFSASTTGFGSPLFGGSQATPAPASFGSSTSTTGSVVTPSFASSNTPVAFGAVGTVRSEQQNPTTQGFASTAPIFGNQSAAANGPAFGSTSTTTTGFGQAPGNLGFGTASTTAPTFGENKPPPSVLGTPASSTGSAFGAPSVFGTPATTSAGFATGNANTGAGGTTGSLISFTANQKPAQQGVFVFGSTGTSSNGAPAATSPPAPFQFGASNLKPAAGFNYAAPSTTASINFGTPGTTGPTFQPPASTMFNIGSGSTAPRARSVRPRKPR